MKEKSMTARPFIKWVGGKGQLLDQLERLLPVELHYEDFTYIEPFVGGGAMLFFMLQKYSHLRKAIINDINGNLTEAYMNVKHHAPELVLRLKNLEKEYLGISSEESRKDFYLVMRRSFNEQCLESIDRTALLIFLNHTCFNGLYRENSKGHFNVPFGRYRHPRICSEELIYCDSELLNRHDVKILNGDYQIIQKHLDSHRLNFLYFDPPYRPLSATSSFNTYVKEAFDDQSQRALGLFCHRLSTNSNVRWMLSNSDCSSKNPEDIFFESLYDGFDIQRVYASRMVNAQASKRGKLSELVIRNYSETSTEETHIYTTKQQTA